MLRRLDLPLIVIGILALLFGISVSLVEVTATEAWILGQTVLTYRPSLDILAQPVQLITNKLPSGDVLAVTVGWGIEFVLIIFVIGYEISARSVQHRNPKISGWWEIGIGACIIADYVTNVIYEGAVAPQIGGFGDVILRLFIAALICGFAMLFPIMGWGLISEGLRSEGSNRGHMAAMPMPNRSLERIKGGGGHGD